MIPQIFLYGFFLHQLWQAQFFERTGVAGFAGFYFWRITALIEPVHFFQSRFYFLPKRFCKRHFFPAADFAVIEGALRDIAAEHLFQAHGLGAELQMVGVVTPWGTPFVFDGIGSISAFLTGQGDAGFRSGKFHHITGPGNPKRGRKDPHIPGNQQLAPAFPLESVMGALMKDFSFHGPEIFRPELFQMDQRPLAAAKLKMLQPGYLEEILFLICLLYTSRCV